MRPYIRMIFMTGFPEEGDAPVNSAFLLKPFRPDELMHALHRELEIAPLANGRTFPS
jgi:hypothetical protein